MERWKYLKTKRVSVIHRRGETTGVDSDGEDRLRFVCQRMDDYTSPSRKGPSRQKWMWMIAPRKYVYGYGYG